jgi:hypothetical protein
VLQIDERIDGIADDEWKQYPGEIFKGETIKVVGVGLDVRDLVQEFHLGNEAEVFVLVVNLDVQHLGHFPQINEQANAHAKANNRVGVIVEHVEKHDELSETPE